MGNKRKYTLRRRAEQQEQTRTRIVEAAMHLHEVVGPRETTISAVAQRAGVQRLTVYRHFPDEAALFGACTAHWLALHPPPDPAGWATLEPVGGRVRAALGSLYRYYRGTARMWEQAYRDVDAVPALQSPMAGFESYLEDVVEGLLPDGPPDATVPSAVATTLRHAVRFSTWRSLSAQGLDDSEAAALAARWVEAAQEADGAAARDEMLTSRP